MQQGESSSYPAQPPPPPPPPDPVPLLGGVPASPISSRPPPALATKPEDIAQHANFPDDDFGDRSISGGGGGNRWPRQETLALLKIRSDMDAAFRDATLKAPLWEAVSRKLAELGYKRSAKKCKEKFENVHKYYKRTKEGRAGRQDGKSYRFFDQLEALHGAVASASSSSAPVAVFAAAPASFPAPIPIMSAPTPIAAAAATNPSPIPAPSMPASAAVGAVAATPTALPPPPPPVAPAVAGVSYSSHTSSSEASESDEDEGGEGRKRKRGSGGGGGGGPSPEMLSFMEGLMRQVMERQETMQQRFLEAIEKREQDRMVREEAWRRQEMLRLNREHDLLVQERAAAASRDAAIVAFLQKMTGQNIQLPPQLAAVVSAPAPPPPSPFQPQQRPSVPLPYHLQPPPPQPPAPPASQQQQQPSPRPQQEPITPQHQHHHQPPPTSSELVAVPDLMDVTGSGSLEPISSRWPKVEVHALINLRSSLELRYQEAGPKGPLWEEISSEMRRLGYNRSAKRCKEKWENINKYFKKVKESNKKRPEDAKTCPYFHQLDALYRQKHHHTNPLPLPAGTGSGFMITQRPHQEINPSPNTNPAPTPQETTGAALAIMAAAAAPPPPPPRPETDNKSGGNGNGGNGDSSGSGAPSNGGLRPPFFDQGTSSDAKPEDIAKELMKLPQSKDPMDDYDNLDDHMDDEDDDDDDDDDDNGDRKLQYRVQFQNSGGGGSGGGGAPPPTGSFLAMV